MAEEESPILLILRLLNYFNQLNRQAWIHRLILATKAQRHKERINNKDTWCLSALVAKNIKEEK
jgi:hypothetical protein